MKSVFKKKKCKSINNEGFTLVEVLAVLAILAVVSVIVIFTVSNIINNAKNKSYSVTINNISKYSETYVFENEKNIMWYDFGIDSLYQCVTVENLINMGYFSNDILESKVSDDRKVLKSDYIFIEKDKISKNIKRYKLLYDDVSLNSYCERNVRGNIIFNVSKADEWTKNKEVEIIYVLDDEINNFDNYSYGYQYEAYNIEYDVNRLDFDYGNIKRVFKNLIVYDNGNLYANILEDDEVAAGNSIAIGKIDIARPVISLGNYTGNNVVRGSVVIPLKLTDKQNGIDGLIDGSLIKTSSVSIDDFKVYIGDNLLTSGVSISNDYKLKIDNYNYIGEVKIIIDENQIYDNVDYGNERTELKPGITFTNLYNISYHSCGGSGEPNEQTKTYGIDLTLSDTIPTKSGYKFLGWSDASSCASATSKTYDPGSKYTKDEDVVLYAVWMDNRLPICTINASEDGTILTVDFDDDTGKENVVYYGWDSSYTGTNSTTRVVSQTGTLTYYVKDIDGYTGSCSVDIINKTFDYNKTIYNCGVTSKTCRISSTKTCPYGFNFTSDRKRCYKSIESYTTDNSTTDPNCSISRAGGRYAFYCSRSATFCSDYNSKSTCNTKYCTWNGKSCTGQRHCSYDGDILSNNICYQYSSSSMVGHTCLPNYVKTCSIFKGVSETCPSDSTLKDGYCYKYNQSTCTSGWSVYSNNYGFSSYVTSGSSCYNTSSFVCNKGTNGESYTICNLKSSYCQDGYSSVGNYCYK